jgi:multidrug efflux system membrane fusion protein
MKGSRITAIGIVAAASAWIASGYFMPRDSAESHAAVRPTESAEKLFRVAVQVTPREPHRQKLVLSGHTEADKKVSIAARTSGVVTQVPVHRGDHVKQGATIAVLADEAREAQVDQARALAVQRRTELTARRQLIEKGMMPKLDLVNLESQVKIAEAQLASAEAERDRGIVRAPWTGVINKLSVEVGQSSFSFMGTEIAQMVSLDPMLAVVEVAERKLGGVKLGEPAEVRLVSGQTVAGKVRYISKTASDTTRTYRIEVEMANHDSAIPDGITCEVAVPLAAVQASRVPRSALTFSSGGDLGVRTVVEGDKVAFVPVSVVGDEQAFMWVSGLPDAARVIVEGQDFVREGQKVEAVAVTDQRTAKR